MCATFAYFTASVTGNGDASSVIVKTAQIGTITYTNGQDLKLENALPGQSSEEKTFTIASTDSNVPVNYSLRWTNITNEISNDELVYTLTGKHKTGEQTGTLVSNKTDEAAPATGQYATIEGTGTLMPGETHEYTLKVTFKETYSDQSSNQDKNFKAKIEVVTGDGNEVYFNASHPSGTTEKPSSDTE